MSGVPSVSLKHGVIAAALMFAEFDWKYGLPDGEFVPEAEQLAKTITRLVQSAHRQALAGTYEKDFARVSSGRFMVEAFVKLEDGDPPCAEVYLHIGTLPLPSHDDTEVSHGS